MSSDGSLGLEYLSCSQTPPPMIASVKEMVQKDEACLGFVEIGRATGYRATGNLAEG